MPSLGLKTTNQRDFYWIWLETLKVFYAWMDGVAVWGRSTVPRMCRNYILVSIHL